jgi:Zn-dependent M32 family carboxypeptidase
MHLLFCQAALKEVSGLEKSIAMGDFRPLREWLASKIHQVTIVKLNLN